MVAAVMELTIRNEQESGTSPMELESRSGQEPKMSSIEIEGTELYVSIVDVAHLQQEG